MEGKSRVKTLNPGLPVTGSDGEARRLFEYATEWLSALRGRWLRLKLLLNLADSARLVELELTYHFSAVGA